MSRTRGKEPFYGYSGFWEVSVFVCVQSNADSNEKASHHARIAQLVEHQYKKCVTSPSPSCANSYVKRELIVVGSSPTPCNKLLIPIGFNRGSCGGSRVAYVTNTTDLNPETWHTVFSRFCNEDRKEIGDIDIDVSPSQRDLVYDYIINRFGQEKTAFILAIGTIKSKGCIDEICRALALRWNREHQRDEKEFRRVMAQLKDENVKIVFGDARDGFSLYFFDEAGNLLLPSRMKDIPRAELIKQFSKEYTKLKEENERIFAKNPWAGKASANIKKEFEADEAAAREKYPEVFYYYDGLLDVAISQSMHPAGIVASPITLRDNYGTFISDGKEILQIDMECVHEVSLVKYDILGLKNIEIIKDAYELLGKPYPKSHEINWNDEAVWKDREEVRGHIYGNL